MNRKDTTTVNLHKSLLNHPIKETTLGSNKHISVHLIKPGNNLAMQCIGEA